MKGFKRQFFNDISKQPCMTMYSLFLLLKGLVFIFIEFNMQSK